MQRVRFIVRCQVSYTRIAIPVTSKSLLIPAGTRHNNNVIITSKDLMMTLLLHRVFVGVAFFINVEIIKRIVILYKTLVLGLIKNYNQYF